MLRSCRTSHSHPILGYSTTIMGGITVKSNRIGVVCGVKSHTEVDTILF